MYMYWRKGEQWGDKGGCASQGLTPSPSLPTA